MTSLIFVDPELVIALDTKIVFVNPDDLQVFKEVDLPADLTKCGLKVAEPAHEEDKDSERTPSATPTERPSIQNVCLSPDAVWMAVTTTGQKAVLLYRCFDVHAKLVSVRPLARASSALVFSRDASRLLVTDKTGDCYEYACGESEEVAFAAPKLLLGHLSIVYDVLWSNDGKFIITCDRDDKIRATNYPETHDIHSYCLGHKEFVAGLALLDDAVLASVSGDKTLRLWDFKSGKQLASVDLPAPGVRLAHQSLAPGENKHQIAVLLHQPNECAVLYDVQQGADGVWQISKAKDFEFPTIVPSALCFAKGRLYVAGAVDDKFSLRVEAVDDGAPEVPENWLTMVTDHFKDAQWKPEDVSGWFKKRYDNVSEYLERKKRRIEEKQKQ